MLLYQGFKSEQDPNGTAYFYHHDGEGNVIATTKHSGQSDHSYRFDDYGGILPDNGNAASNRNEGSNGWIAPHNSYTLSQKQYDAHTNLYYFGSRHYDPEVGVWINQDSYRGELQNPQSLHRYMYNYDSPVNYVDWQGYVPTESNINSGAMEFSCNCGWIDWGHAGLGSKNDPNPAIRLMKDIEAANTKTNKKPWEFWKGEYEKTNYITIDIHGGPRLPLNGRFSEVAYTVQISRDLSEQEKKEVALGILLQLSSDYESHQGDWRHSLYNKISNKTSSSFSEEDLPSNKIGFYRVLEGYSVDAVKSICNALGKEKSLQILDGYSFRKNQTFNPVGEQGNVSACGIYCPSGVSKTLPKQFNTIKPRPEGDKWRLFRRYP